MATSLLDPARPVTPEQSPARPRPGRTLRLSVMLVGLPAVADALMRNVDPALIADDSLEIIKETARGQPPSILWALTAITAGVCGYAAAGIAGWVPWRTPPPSTVAQLLYDVNARPRSDTK